jgi:hypothetical protein
MFLLADRELSPQVHIVSSATVAEIAKRTATLKVFGVDVNVVLTPLCIRVYSISDSPYQI